MFAPFQQGRVRIESQTTRLIIGTVTRNAVFRQNRPHMSFKEFLAFISSEARNGTAQQQQPNPELTSDAG